MKRLLLFMLAFGFAISVSAQTTDNNNNNNNHNKPTRPIDPKIAEQKAKQEEAHKKQQEKIAEQKQKQQEAREKQKLKIDQEKKEQEEKREKDKLKQQQRYEKSHGSAPHSRYHSRRNDDAPEPDPEVVQLYYQLPLADLPQVDEYLKTMRPINNNDDLKDGKDFRKGFIANTDGTRQLLHLQRPGETKYTRIQEYKTKDFKRILAVETTACKGVCNNDLKFYRLEGKDWKDVTNEYLYRVKPKDVLKKIKDKYKDEYMDTELYDSKGYDDSTNFAKAINYIISPTENKIIIREQYLPLNLYEMTWNPDKGKFDIKKN